VDFDTIADELYGLSPAEFTAARDQRAAEARRAGERRLSEEVKKLRRPTVGAWLANVLARQRPDQLAQLLDLGAQLRRAQEDLSAADLRRLASQRHQVVGALSAEAAKLAGELGQAVSGAAVRELETTLEAVLADEGAAGAVRLGRLTTALQYSGFGPVDLSGAVGGPVSHTAPAAGRPTVAAHSRPAQEKGEGKTAAERRQEERRETAEQQLREAEAAVRGGRHQVAEEGARLAQAQQRYDRLQAELVQLDQQLKELQEQGSEAAREVRQGQKAHDAAAAVLHRAEAALEKATQVVAERD